MPKGIDSSRDPNRRPQIVDLNHFRRTGQIADVSDINAIQRGETIREEMKKTHPASVKKPLKSTEWFNTIDPLLASRKKKKEETEELGEDDAPPHGIPRPNLSQYPNIKKD